MQVLVSLLALVTLVFGSLAAADGPTPYPDATNVAAWPGKGPIRTFPYMTDNRKGFWNQREKDQGKVVFVGDSLIGGWAGLAKGTAFPSLKVANRGIGGDTSRGVLFRFQEDVLDLHPRAIVISAGSNDNTAQGSPDDTIANLASMLEMARKQDAQVPIVICTVHPVEIAGFDLSNSRQILRARVKAFGEGKVGLVILDLYPIFGDAEGRLVPDLYGKDHVHLNADGYAKWVAALAPVLGGLGVK